MEIHKISLTNDKVIDNTEFIVQTMYFILKTFNKTNISRYTSDGFEIILNHGTKVYGIYEIVYIHSQNLIVQFKKQTNKGIDITTITIPVSVTLTNTLKEEIEEFIKNYLEENNK